MKIRFYITCVIFSMLLFGMMSSSQAREIIEFPSDTEDYSYDGWTYHTAYLKTDVPFYCVWWYVDGKYAGWSDGSNQKTEAYFSPYDKIPGEIKGKKYTIKAEVGWLEDDGTSHWATDSYTVRMFESIDLYHFGENTGAWGYVEISRFYYDGSQIIMDAYIYAINPTNNPEAQDPENYPLSVLPWFWTQKYPGPDGNAEDERRDTKPIEIIQLGKTSQTYNPGPLTDPDPVTGERKPFTRDVGTIEKGKPVYYKAHAHLQVFDGRNPADNWEVDTQQQTLTAAVTFTSEDGP